VKLKEFLEDKATDYEENTLDELIKIVKRNLIDSKEIFKFLDEKEKNIIRSKDLILFSDI